MLITEQLRQQLLANTYSREIKIEIDSNIIIQPSNIVSETLEIDRAVMDTDSLLFGGCISSKMTVNVVNVNNVMSSDLEGKQIKVYIQQGYHSTPNYPSSTLYPDTTLLPGLTTSTHEQVIYTGYIYSAIRQKKRNVYEIIAFDEMYRMSQMRCKLLLSSAMNYDALTSQSTLDNIMYYVLNRYDGYYDTNLSSDYVDDHGFQWSVNRTTAFHLDKQLLDNKADENLSVLDILAAHSELNARFAFINAEGHLKFTALYEVTNGSSHSKIYNVTVTSYNGLEYKDYNTASVGYISFPYQGGDSRFDYGSTTDKRRWYISKNILATLSTNISVYITAFYRQGGYDYIFNNISVYRPYSVRTFGEWWIEPSDVIYLSTGDTDYPQLKGFVLSQRLSGVAGMKVDLEAKGGKWLNKDEFDPVSS